MSVVPDDPFVTFDQLVQYGITYKRKTLWEKCRKGEFPAPLHLSTNRVAWRRSAIVKWMDSRQEREMSKPKKTKAKAKSRT